MEEIHKEIGALLLKGPKTAEEIAEELGRDIRDVMEALKDLITLRLVVKEGNPPRYSLAPHVKIAVEEDVSGILVHAIVEAEAVEEDILRKALDDIVSKLRSEKSFIVKSVSVADIIRDEETKTFVGHVDVTLVFPSIEPLFYFIFFYGPTVVELLTEEKIEVDPSDLQAALILTASMVQGYVSYISRLLGKKEIEEFNRELLRRLKGSA